MKEELIFEEKARKAKKNSAVEQPPLTPMIDVTFQLLIFFMVTIEFREKEGHIPGSLPGESQPIENLTVNIKLRSTDVDYDTCEYVIDDRPPIYDANELIDVLGEIREMKPEASVLIKTSQIVRWNFCMEAYNAAMTHKFKRVSFAPQR